jgi:HCOMODA/2-hydroxy-3-carboxy-muconic semialdehyde decarboxylase
MKKDVSRPGGFVLRCLAIVLMIGLGVGIVSIMVAPQATAAAQTSTAPSTIAALKQDLVVANRILFDEGIIDTSGHVSVRLDESRYLMSWAHAPELIVVDDIVEYDIEGNVNDPKNRPGYFERFIHAEIYRARPDIRAVVHGHTPTLIMFASSSIPLRPLYRNAAFIGESVPVFKNGEAGGEIRDTAAGRRMVAAMGKGSALLLHGHGAVIAAPNLVGLVNRSIALQTNARLVAQILAMGDTQPAYIRPNPAAGGGEPAAPQGGPGGNNSRQWLGYKHRAGDVTRVRSGSSH